MNEKFLTAGPFRPAADYNALLKDDGDWILPGILPTDGLVILASAPKTGKTCLATAIARAVATGTPFAGRTPHQPGPVLWCAHEEGPRERRLLHQGLTIHDPLLIAYSDDLPSIDAPESSQDRFGRALPASVPYVFDHAVEVGAKLIVVDSLHAAVHKGSLADNTVARRIVGRLKRLATYYHVAVLVLHHLTKSASRGHDAERFADSAQILASADAHFFLDRSAPDASGESRVVLHGKGRYPSPPARQEFLSRHVLDYRETEPEPREPSAADRIRDLHTERPDLQPKEIAEKLDLSLNVVKVTLSRLRSSA